MSSATWKARPFARLPIFASIAVVIGLFAPGTALAEPPPANDDFDSAVVVGGLPFHMSMSTVWATDDADDPVPICGSHHTVWFSFTPDHDLTIEADTFGSNSAFTTLSAYTGSRGALNLVPGTCVSGERSRVIFAATAGTTYHFMLGNYTTFGSDLTFSVGAVTAPPNDNFASAAAMTGLPSQQASDTIGATLEPGEPTSPCATVSGSLWYSFTPANTGSVTASTSLSSAYPVLTTYTGNSVNTLTEVACRIFTGPMTFRAIAGQTYYLQLGDAFGSGPSPVRLSLDVAPVVEAQLGYYPSDPSMFDQVGFYDRSFDPGGAPIVTEQWRFGDGTSGTGNFLNHRYAADGDYPVSLTVTTSDGRMASTSQVVQIRTHDVSIDRFTAPNTAHAGQTKRITVDIRNARYDEDVRVELYRSGPSGFELVGVLNQLVVARPNRTVEFPFNYTFTADDAAAGKVTFRAVATLLDHRDALPPDNEVISTPTTVN